MIVNLVVANAIVVADIPIGTDPVTRLSGFPRGKASIRRSADDVPKVRIRTADGIREFIPQREDGKWTPFQEIRRNVTAPPEISH